MKIIGITGGVGAGKSLVLDYLEKQHQAYVLYADRIANDLKMPGEVCYIPLIHLLGEDICQQDGLIDKSRMAEKIFQDKALLAKVNEIVHPAVKEYICSQIADKRQQGDCLLFVIEAALLIEDHYDEICDEMWYIYADIEKRRQRLIESRGYTDERIYGIVSEQLSDTAFRNACQFVIDNSGKAEETYIQIDKKLREE